MLVPFVALCWKDTSLHLVAYAVLQSPFSTQIGDGLSTNGNEGKLQEKSFKTGKLTTDSSYYS